MAIYKFYCAMAYFPFTFLDETIKEEYKLLILRLIAEISKKRVSNSYSRHFLYDIFKDLDIEIGNFILLHNKKLTLDQQRFMRGLLNLTKNVKRFVNNTRAKFFPAAFLELTTLGLQQFLKEYVKERNFKHDQEIQLLATDFYIELANKIWIDAENTLLNYTYY